MCGIFGILINKKTDFSSALLKSVINELFILSESRGKEAAGIAIFQDDKTRVYKEGVIASIFIHNKRYKQLLDETFNGVIKRPIVVLGHTRLATNGPQADNNNNCPIISGDVVGVHNGIIVNDDLLYKIFPSIQRIGEVDSELIFNLLNLSINNNLSLITATQTVFSKIQGSASIAALIPKYKSMVLATNTGSLYSCRNTRADAHIFASEPYILQILVKKLKLASVIGQYNISQLKAGYGCVIDIHKLTEQSFSLN